MSSLSSDGGVSRELQKSGSTEEMEDTHHSDSAHSREHSSPLAGSEPFPALETPFDSTYDSPIPALNTQAPTFHQAPANPHSPITGLKLQTEHLAQKNRHRSRSTDNSSIPESAESTVYNAGLPVRNSSIRSSQSARHPRRDSLSPSSISSSPAIGPLVDMTPLPSPISRYGSPRGWRRSLDGNPRDSPPEAGEPRKSPENGGLHPTIGSISPKKRKIPTITPIGLSQSTSVADHNENARSANRSISEYVPAGLQTPKTRHIVVSASGQSIIAQQLTSTEDALHREQRLAVHRGLIPTKLPTPPASSQGSESGEVQRDVVVPSNAARAVVEYEAISLRSGNLKRWYAIRQLGEGQFSKVMLATREDISNRTAMDPLDLEKSCQPRSLVAVKVCHHGPAGGADEKSVETSIKRELDLMKTIDHPSLVHLKAVNALDRQTLFVLHYCPGGDLFDLASTNLDLLSAPLIRRIFAELVSAVQYLHAKFIVHRDIKLESIRARALLAK